MKIVLKNRLIAGIAVLALATGGLYGCGDFLDENATPQGALDAGTLANKAGVEGTLIGAYRALDCIPTTEANWGCAASNWVWGGVAADDAYKGSDSGDQPPINDIEGYNWGTGNAELYLNVKWRVVYEGVVRANSALRLLAAVRASSPSEFSVAEANGIAGEAIFLRAHYHFEAWRMWGNIPYYREDETDFRKPNEASAAVVTDILKDLDSAAKLLANTPRNNQVGRPSAWTAKAYKGRVQVYAGQFAAAVTTLSDVRTNGPYALESSFDKVWTGFQAAANGKETIWAFQASANDGEPNGNNANWGERLNFPYSGSHFGCCGFNQPSQNLVNFYKTDAQGLPLALSAPATWNASDANFQAGDMTPVDPRLDWTVGRNGVPYKDWGPVKVTTGSDSWVRDIGNGGPYTPKKNAHEKASGAESGSGWQNTQLNSVNIHLYRYADLLLLLAEAMVETNDLAGARTIVNEIRARAAVTAQGPGTSAADIAVAPNSPSITWAFYRIGQYTLPFASQAEARAAVRAERRLELGMEGQRFFDLRRYGATDAAAAINGYINGIGGGAEKSAARRTYKAFAVPFAAKHMWYPIPQTQIDLSKVGGTSTLTQNTGW
jgi:starch-binding outer membrane protein, SusD/RagB family